MKMLSLKILFSYFIFIFNIILFFCHTSLLSDSPFSAPVSGCTSWEQGGGGEHSLDCSSEDKNMIDQLYLNS